MTAALKVGIAGFASYEAYRDSGVEWIGEVPEHWNVTRLDRSVLKSDDKVESEAAEGIPYVGLEHVASWTGSLLPFDEQQTPESKANSFAAGDVLFGKLRPYLAKAFSADFSGLCSTEFLVLKPFRYERRYLLYLLLTDGIVSLVDSSTYGVKMPRASWDFIRGLAVPLPPLEEQCAIATSLDREMERVGALVARKRMLIERLQEYRSALITRAVTRGLPPEAAHAAGLHPWPQLRFSGVEQLGEVPEHWHVKRLKHVAAYYTSSVDKKIEDGEIPVRLCNYTDVYYRECIRAGRGAFMEATVSPREIARFKLHVGDVLVTKDSEDWRDIGVPALIEETADDFVCGYHLGIIRPGPTVHPPFLLRGMQSLAVNQQIQTFASGITRYGLPNGAVGNTTVAIPPLVEQRAIAAFLDRETGRLDALVAKERLLIERMQEYRTALVTGAVTGKIDVRESARGQLAPQ